MKKWPLVVSGILLLGMATTLVLWKVFVGYLSTPTSLSAERKAEVLIPENATSSVVVDLLSKQNLIAKPDWLLLYLDHFRESFDPKPGEYALVSTMSPQAMLEYLERGEKIRYPVVLKPGETAKDLFLRLGELRLAHSEVLVPLIHDPDFAQKLGLLDGSLEGRLHPDAYALEKGLKPEELLKSFVDKHKKNLSAEFVESAKQRGLSEHQLIALASLVELGPMKGEERRILSAIYHNRLKKGMNLENRASVAYGLSKPVEALTEQELKQDHDWNTFVRPGLPKTPICAPSAESIAAAARPAETDAIYFVPKGDGTHFFCADDDCYFDLIGKKARR